MGSQYTYHHLPIKLVRVDDQIRSADGTSWLDPIARVEYSQRRWTKLWWTTKPALGCESRPDLERPNETMLHIRRPRPNHDVTRDEIADEFARHGCTFEFDRPTELRITKTAGGRRRAALLYFHADTGTFAGAHIRSEYVRSIDVVRRHLGVPTHH